MSAIQCEKCGQTLALADSHCRACGTPVPAQQRLALLQDRAEGLAAQERFADAARALEPALALPLDAPALKGLWRKKGVWLRKAAADQPQLLDAAEAALAEALKLDDLDDLSHQVWIDLLVQRGLADKAKAWYQQRLQLNPEDGMAKRQMAVLRLAMDFKAQPVARREAPAAEPKGLLWRIVVPTTAKTAAMAFNGVFCLAMFVRSLGGRGAPGPADAAAPADAELASILAGADSGTGELFKAFDDPWSWGLQFAASAAYVYWGYSRRKRG